MAKSKKEIRFEFENFVLSEEQKERLADAFASDVARAILDELGYDADELLRGLPKSPIASAKED